MPETGPHLLELRNISKTFPGVKALQNVQLHANKGLVHALMGENGAGKSTLMKILSGAYMPDPGAEIRIDGKQVSIDGPLAAKALGVSVIYQELSLAPNLTVAENIYMGRPCAASRARWSTAPRMSPNRAKPRCSGSAPTSARRRASRRCRSRNASWWKSPAQCISTAAFW